MHQVRVPKHSGAHRVACLSLYRALIRQCGSPTATTSCLHESKGLIRHNFRKYKALQSPTQIVNALKAGYEALDLISLSHHNPQHQTQLTTLIANAKSQREKYATLQQKTRPVAPPPSPLTPRAAQKAKTIRFQEETTVRRPDTPSILDRPKPLGSLGDRKRHVPVLVNARGIPFLRYKKPQPRNISSTLRNKLATRWTWIQRRDRLKEDLLFAQDEEDWDRRTGIQEQSTWSESTKASLADVNSKINTFDQKSKALAEHYWEIVLAEKALAKEEALAAKALAGDKALAEEEASQRKPEQ